MKRLLFLPIILCLFIACKDGKLRSHNDSYFDIEYTDNEIMIHKDGTPDDTLHKGKEGYYDSDGRLFLCYQKDTTVYCPQTMQTINSGFYKINYDKKTSLSTTQCFVENVDENNNVLKQYYSSFVYDKDYKIKKIRISEGVEYY